MKLLLIFGSDETFALIYGHVKSLGFDLIRYRHIIKAMDNIDEIDPDAIIISAVDFPKHWKTFVQHLCADRPRGSIPIILLRGEKFTLEENAKAAFLGVGGIVSCELTPIEIDRLQIILESCKPLGEKRRAKRFRPEEWAQLDFVFIHPKSKKLITGSIQSISNCGLSFRPDQNAILKMVAPGQELSDCSLSAGKDILDPVCRVVRSDKSLAMEFVSINEKGKRLLDACLKKLSL